MFTFKVTVMSRSQVIVILPSGLMDSYPCRLWLDLGTEMVFLWGNPLGISPPPFLPQVVCGQLPEAAIQHHNVITVISLMSLAYILSVDNLHCSAVCTCVYVT